MSPTDRKFAELLNGLKLHCHRPPLSLEMVSVPLGPAADVVPLPQAANTAAIRPPAAASASFLKRLIEVVLHYGSYRHVRSSAKAIGRGCLSWIARRAHNLSRSCRAATRPAALRSTAVSAPVPRCDRRR